MDGDDDETPRHLETAATTVWRVGFARLAYRCLFRSGVGPREKGNPVLSVSRICELVERGCPWRLSPALRQATTRELSGLALEIAAAMKETIPTRKKGEGLRKPDI